MTSTCAALSCREPGATFSECAPCFFQRATRLCEKHFEEQKSIVKCAECDDPLCEEHAQTCDACFMRDRHSKTFCKKCSPFTVCVDCEKRICDKCNEEDAETDEGYVTCVACGKLKCDGCACGHCCTKCDMMICVKCIEAVGGGCSCLQCPACASGSRDKCECGALAVFCYECENGNEEGTEPMCEKCLEKKRKREEEEEEVRDAAKKIRAE